MLVRLPNRPPQVSLRKLAPYADKSRGKRKQGGGPADEATEKIKEDRKTAKKRFDLNA